MSEELTKRENTEIREGEFRDINTITTEIRTLYQTALRSELSYAVQLGRKLTEAKALVDHGEWGNWIRDNLPFSQDKASMMMKIYDAYGSNQESLFGDINSETFRNLGISQAFALLSVPEDEREQFVKDNDAENMSVRELKKAIEERDAAAKAKKALEEDNKKLRTSNIELNKKFNDAEDRRKKAQRDLDVAAKDLKETKAALDEAKAKPAIPADVITKLQEEAKEEAGKEAAETIARETARREEAEKETQELRKKLAVASPEAATFKTYFEMFQEDFNRLNGLLMKIENTDAVTAGKFRNALQTVIGQFTQKLTQEG